MEDRDGILRMLAAMLVLVSLPAILVIRLNAGLDVFGRLLLLNVGMLELFLISAIDCEKFSLHINLACMTACIVWDHFQYLRRM